MAKNKYIGKQFEAANGDIHIAVANTKPVQCRECSLENTAIGLDSDSYRAFKAFGECKGIHFKLHMKFHPKGESRFKPSGRYRKGYEGIKNAEICSICHQTYYDHEWKNEYEGEKMYCSGHYTMVKQ